MRRHLQRIGSRTIGRGPRRRSRCRAARLAAVAALVSLACLAAVALAGSQEPPAALAAETGLAEAPVWITQVKGIVDPAMASYLVKTMK
jgi:hypothetical protein